MLRQKRDRPPERIRQYQAGRTSLSAQFFALSQKGHMLVGNMHTDGTTVTVDLDAGTSVINPELSL